MQTAYFLQELMAEKSAGVTRSFLLIVKTQISRVKRKESLLKTDRLATQFISQPIQICPTLKSHIAHTRKTIIRGPASLADNKTQLFPQICLKSLTTALQLANSIKVLRINKVLINSHQAKNSVRQITLVYRKVQRSLNNYDRCQIQIKISDKKKQRSRVTKNLNIIFHLGF